MAEVDVEKFVNSKYSDLFRETTESKMFNLGVCYGYFLTYKTLKELGYADIAESLTSFAKDDETYSDLLTMIKMYQMPNKFNTMLMAMRKKDELSKDELSKDEVDMVSEFAEFLYQKGIKENEQNK